MIRQNVSLKEFSNYKIGGPALYFLEASSKDILVEDLKNWDKDLPAFILGNGTNILISEKGFEGLVIHCTVPGVDKQDDKVTVGAGVLVSDLLNFCVENSLSGLEWAGGLPGSIGGAVRGNAGAFGGETKDLVLEVMSLDIKTLEEKKRNNKECEFGYRTSIFKTKAKDEIILTVKLGLKKGDKEAIKKSIREKIDYRYKKHPMDRPSLGSTFKNIPVVILTEQQKKDLMQFVKNDPFPVIPVAKLLYLCNLKGKREGDAQISEKHPNFIVNLGNAKTDDVKNLIEFAKKAVKEKFNVTLEEEIMYL